MKEPLSTFSTILAPGTSTLLRDSATNSYMCCPATILQILATGADLSHEAASSGTSNRITDAGLGLFNSALAFDLDSWATELSNVPIERQAMDVCCRKNAGAAYQVSVCLYLLRAIPSIQALVPRGFRQALRRQLISHLASISDDDPNFNSTLWPAFVAGAEAETSGEQAWILDRFHRLTAVFPWGSLQTAIDVMQFVWQSRQQSVSSFDWLGIVKDSGTNLLLV